MYYITNEHPDAPGVWCLCEDGKIVKQFVGNDTVGREANDLHTRSLAASALFEADPVWPALVAAGEAEGFATWESAPGIAFTETPTSDRRFLVGGEVGFRAFPLPWMLQTVTAWGHQGAVIAGRIDDAKEQDDNSVWAIGVFDNSANGKEAERLARNGMLRGVSVDIGFADVEWEITEIDEDGWPIDWLDKFSNIEVMGATQTPFPAFGKAAIKVTSAEEGAEVASGAGGEADPPSSLSAAGILNPPVAWFGDPQLKEATPLTITDEGQVFGHIAAWSSCHIGYSNSCVAPPKSKTDYSYFATGVVKCDEGCEIPVGVLTIEGGHADVKDSPAKAAAHYDDAGTAWADVAVGEDQYGIWVAGGVRPGTTDEQLHAARASAPSGDWRRLSGNLELVAVLMVNVPGFNVPRGITAGGEQMSLVAAVAPMAKKEKPKLGAGALASPAAITKRFQALEQRVDRHERTLAAVAQEQEAQRIELRNRLVGPTIENLQERLGISAS